MGKYQEQLSGLLKTYQVELARKRTTLRAYEEAVQTVRSEITELEELVAQLQKTSVKQSHDGVHSTIGATVVQLPPATGRRGRRTQRDWLGIIRREFSGREFTARELAGTSGASLEGVRSALEKLENVGLLNRRGGRNDPSQHEVQWSLRANSMNVFAQPRVSTVSE